jgi:hypothetical protein
MQGSPFHVAACGVAIFILGYWLSSTIKTWQHSTTFFLTLFVTTVLGRSEAGMIGTVIPTIFSIIMFERDRSREKRLSSHAEMRGGSYATFPVKQWDGRLPLVVFDTLRFLSGEEVYEYVNSREPGVDMRLCACRPVWMEPVEANDLTMGCGDEVDLPENVQFALDVLNKEIAACEPISWEQDEIAIDIADLIERSKAHTNTEKEEFAL